MSLAKKTFYVFVRNTLWNFFVKTVLFFSVFFFPEPFVNFTLWFTKTVEFPQRHPVQLNQ